MGGDRQAGANSTVRRLLPFGSGFSSIKSSSSSSGSGSVHGSGGSFQVAQTPKVLFPHTPTPIATVHHPQFDWNSYASLRTGCIPSMSGADARDAGAVSCEEAPRNQTACAPYPEQTSLQGQS